MSILFAVICLLLVIAGISLIAVSIYYVVEVIVPREKRKDEERNSKDDYLDF